MDIKKLDKVFSEYIRRRDADEYGRVKCCTCPTVAHWAEMDCGHWRSRHNKSIRFEESDNHAQCRECNRTNDGEYQFHEAYIVKRYGSREAKRLIVLSHKAKHWMQHEIDELVKKYKLKIKSLN